MFSSRLIAIALVVGSAVGAMPAMAVERFVIVGSPHRKVVSMAVKRLSCADDQNVTAGHNCANFIVGADFRGHASEQSVKRSSAHACGPLLHWSQPCTKCWQPSPSRFRRVRDCGGPEVARYVLHTAFSERGMGTPSVAETSDACRNPPKARDEHVGTRGERRVRPLREARCLRDLWEDTRGHRLPLRLRSRSTLPDSSRVDQRDAWAAPVIVCSRRGKAFSCCCRRIHGRRRAQDLPCPPKTITARPATEAASRASPRPAQSNRCGHVRAGYAASLAEPGRP